jgi:hypothetical protein
MFRALLIAAILFFVARYVFKLLRPGKQRPENISGKPRDPSRGIDQNRIEDAEFKDIPEK